ncbi:MAG: c-type cytochrome biogenesis protein CcmI [Gammaproteobacteria bacterium]|nr:c-type cytochrome biogenesis protein CcmI [Gammaproteobacteria bacterium]
MILFWIISAAMLLAALALLLPTLLRPKQFIDPDLNLINVNIAKQRLNELDAEYQAGQHSEVQYQQIQKDLEQQLANDLEKEHAPQTRKEIQSSKSVAIIIASVVPILAISLYLTRGDLDAMEMSGPGAGANREINSMVAQNGGTMPTVDEMIVSLKQKLADKPNNPQGWYMLARSYMALKQYNDAVGAWKELLSLIGPNDAEVLVQYADALAMTQGGRLTGKPAEQVFQALELNPNNTQGLWLAGMAMQEKKDYPAALNYWKRLEPNMDDDPESQTALRDLINRAEQKLQQPVTNFKTLPSIASAAQAPAQAALGKDSIRLEIDLDPNLAAKVAIEDSLFIYAKAMSGPPMPLAAVRKKAIDLPLSITLNDSMAMMPQMKLSNFAQVKVGARISKSGNAIAQDGDFYAEVQSVTVGQEAVVKILIKQIKGHAQRPGITPTAVVTPTATEATQAAVAADAINVSIRLSPDLASRVSPEDALFIYAKALRGPPMPLAAVRKQVKDLPLQLTLNDAMAMMPQMKLSSFKQVKIGARISKSGNAIGQAGDLFGEVQPVTVGQSATVNLMIQHIR